MSEIIVEKKQQQQQGSMRWISFDLNVTDGLCS